MAAGARNLEHVARPAGVSDENAFRQVLRTIGLLERIMQPYFARFGITGSQWGVLRNLYRAEREGWSKLRLTDLSVRLLIRPPSVTGVVGRLERAGLVTRDATPVDLRSKCVGLTDKGRELVAGVLDGHGDQIAALMSGLSSRDERQLSRLLNQWQRHLEGMLPGPAGSGNGRSGRTRRKARRGSRRITPGEPGQGLSP